MKHTKKILKLDINGTYKFDGILIRKSEKGGETKGETRCKRFSGGTHQFLKFSTRLFETTNRFVFSFSFSYIWIFKVK